MSTKSQDSARNFPENGGEISPGFYVYDEDSLRKEKGRLLMKSQDAAEDQGEVIATLLAKLDLVLMEQGGSCLNLAGYLDGYFLSVSSCFLLTVPRQFRALS